MTLLKALFGGSCAAVTAVVVATVLSSYRWCIMQELVLSLVYEKLLSPDCSLWNWPSIQESCASTVFLATVLIPDQCLPLDVESRPALPHRLTFLAVVAQAKTVAAAVRVLGDAPLESLLRQPSSVVRFGEMQGTEAHPRQFPSWWVPGLRAQARWPPELFPWVKVLEAAHHDVLQEFLDVNDAGISDYNIPEWDGKLTIPGWKTFHFIDQKGGIVLENVHKAPKTWALLQSIPRVCLSTMAMFSIVLPGGAVEAHTGYSNLFLRVHLTLFNKYPDLAFLEVGGERFAWHEGKVIVFDDSFWHTFRNDGSSPRAVLFFDIWHPSIADEELPAIKKAYEEYNRSPIMTKRQRAAQAVESRSRKEVIEL